MYQLYSLTLVYYLFTLSMCMSEPNVLMDKMRMMVMSPFAQFGLWVPSSGDG
jgi:hypothetical protein